MPIARRDFGNAREDHPVSRDLESAQNLQLQPLTGPLSSGPTNDQTQGSMWTSNSTPTNQTIETRAELIERLKKTSPPWLQSGIGISTTEAQAMPPPSQELSLSPLSSLLPAAEIGGRGHYTSTERPPVDPNQPGFERPRPALHAGDFRPESPHRQIPEYFPRTPTGPSPPSRPWLSTSPTTPWYVPSLNSTPRPGASYRRPSIQETFDSATVFSRSRAGSISSLSSSFVRHPPSSPLAQQFNNSDWDYKDEKSSRRRSRSPDKASRRHTFSPRSFQALRRSPPDYRTAYGRTEALPTLHRQESDPFQAHQPHRSISTFQGPFSYSSTYSPYLHRRRPSISSDLSPIQRAPLVGPYEESILRGRMSTLPSKPLDFVAQIGVLGKGECKASLRCPPHLSVAFPAVFYSYGEPVPRLSSTTGGPSPYVGLIDLQHSSKPSEDFHQRDEQYEDEDPMLGIETYANTSANAAVPLDLRENKRRKRKDPHSPSKKAPKGSYRIPQQGQLQIVIKNPNKSAVKLFLVPYDLTGMEAGQKTFIRQRSYSAGPIIDMPLTSRSNLGTDRPEAALSSSDNPADRPVLRYLIHLNICSPSAGRFYLYKSIRVVFANRVPDGKEKLRNEIQLPEPRYSAWRPERPVSKPITDWNFKDRTARSSEIAGLPHLVLP